jgi:hypothetical protein
MKAKIVRIRRRESDDLPELDLPALRDAVTDYLRASTYGRRRRVASACGVSLRQLNYYLTGERTLNDVEILHRFYTWMRSDVALTAEDGKRKTQDAAQM